MTTRQGSAKTTILEGRGIGGGVREYNANRFLFRMDNFLMAPLVFIT